MTGYPKLLEIGAMVGREVKLTEFGARQIQEVRQSL